MDGNRNKIMKKYTAIFNQIIYLKQQKDKKILEFQTMIEEDKNTEEGKNLYGEINFYAGEISALEWTLVNNKNNENKRRN